MKQNSNKNREPKGKIETKNIIVMLILASSVIGVAIYGIAFSPLVLDDLYITGNDVIKNYTFESFDGNDIVDGVVSGLDNKLKVEAGAFWKTTENDLEIIGNPIVNGNITTVAFFVTMRNKVNIYTNVRLNDAIETNFNTVSEVFRVGDYEHLGYYGHHLDGFESYLTWNHYDFGDVRQHNLDNNLFSGALKASFDINPNPIPLNFSDADGNLIEKQFDYIAINAMWVSDSIYGKMSTDMPSFVELTPAHYEEDERNDYAGGTPQGTMIADTDDDEDYTKIWNPDPTLSVAAYQTIESGIQPASNGSTLNPKTKSGVSLWDPVFDQKSQTDCSFTYNLGALSPLVYEYSSTLTYYEQSIQVQDYTYWDFLLLKSGSKENYDHDTIQSQTRQVGLHVTNRYIQAELSVKFKLYTQFKIEIAETEEADLDLPEEYYDELLWQMIVDGFGGGKTYKETITLADLTGIITIVAVLLIVGVGGYILYTVYKRRSKEKFLLQLAGRR